MRRTGARRMRWAAVVVAAATPLAAGVLIPASAAAPPEGEGPTGAGQVPDALYASPTRFDRVGRVLAAVEIDGQGPFRFILDTGASRSALAPRLVERIGLRPAEERVVGVHGVTGSAVLPAVHVAQLRAGEIEMRNVSLPVLSEQVFAGADGILGVEGLQGARVEVDFTRDRVVIAPSTRSRAPRHFVTVPLVLHSDGLLMAVGRVEGIRIKVIVDTGAERTLGNLPLQRALEKGVRRRERSQETVIGVTPDVQSGTSFRTAAVTIGAVTLNNARVTFGDLPVFGVWGLAEEPAMLIGMDLLGTVRKFVIDYPRRELQILTQPSTLKPGVRRCGPGECQSRIPEPQR